MTQMSSVARDGARITPPSELARMWPIEETDVPLLRFRGLPDLDDLLLYLASIDGGYGNERYWPDEDDRPTRLAWQRRGGELPVGWFRVNPCTCGEHGWHVDYAPSIDRDTGPTGPRPGVFLGAWE